VTIGLPRHDAKNEKKLGLIHVTPNFEKEIGLTLLSLDCPTKIGMRWFHPVFWKKKANEASPTQY